MLIEYLKALFLGIVEGITEWLPISSTGHLILLGEMLAFDCRLIFGGDQALAAEFSALLDVVIQLGAVLAVACIYFGELWPSGSNKKQALRLYLKLFCSTLPAAFIGLLADTICKKAFGRELEELIFCPQVVASALIAYGLLFIVAELLTKGQSTDEITTKKALCLGFFQALALIPGTSRSGATILGARILGVSRESAAKFSFFMALPVIGAASFLQIFDFSGYMLESGAILPPQAYFLLAVAALTAFAVSMAAVRFLTDFVKKHSFIPFGIYRIALGAWVLIALK